MLFKDDNDKPPTSKEEADARRVRPPPERYDPDSLSHWSITMMVAWIIWREIDGVRNEWDDYRNECADWRFEGKASARAKVAGIAMKHISTGKLTRLPGKLARLPKKLRKDFQKGSWHLHQWPSSGWNRLYLRAISKNIREPGQQAILPPQVAIDSLWLAGGEGRIKATALEYENAKAFDGNPIEIPANHWPHLKRADDRSTGKAMLSADNGRVYREVLFLRLGVKELWPKSAENARIVPARKGRKPMYDWEDAMNFAKSEFENRGDYNDPQNAVDGWRGQADWARLVSSYMEKHNSGKEPSESEVKRHLKDLLDSIRK
jgi:hypothetical protein